MSRSVPLVRFARQAFSTRQTFESANQSKYWLLQYDYVDQMLDRRVPFRAAHLELANQMTEQGKLLLGGAHVPESSANQHPKSATLVFHCDRTEAEKFAQNDPYVKNGLVTNWKLVEWTVVVGSAMK